MKIERLNDNQMRFIFQTSELMARGINFQDMLANTPGASRDKSNDLFQEITGILRQEYDFVEHNNPLMFEASMRGDTLTIIVTRMDSPEGEAHFNSFGIPGLEQLLGNLTKSMQQGRSCPHAQPAPPKTNSGYTLFSFENFDLMATAATRIPETYGGKSHAYKLEGKHYLLMENTGTAQLSTQFFEKFLHDFGTQHPTNKASYHQMLEYGDILIAYGAIDKLKKYSQWV